MDSHRCRADPRHHAVTGGSGSSPSAIDLCGPRGIALDGSGNLYIADQLNSQGTFEPTAVGVQKGTLVIFDNAKHEPQMVKLKGQGK